MKIAAIFLFLTGLAAAQTVSFKTTTLTAICQQGDTNSRLVQSLVTGDFNGDGNTDIAYACKDRIVALLGKGDGTFQAPSSTAITADVQSKATSGTLFGVKLGTGRFTDLIYSFNTNLAGVGYQFLRFVSNGDGTFQVNPTATTLRALAVGDFNADQITDLVVQIQNTIAVVLGQAGGFGSPQGIPAVSGPNFIVAVGDFNADGKMDIIDRQVSDVTYFLQGKGDGTFVVPVKSLPINVPDAVGDFNGDRKPDSASISGANVAVALGNGDGTFGAAVNSPAQTGFLIVADLNGDGRADLVNAAATGLFSLLSKGDGNMQAAGQVSINLGTDFDRPAGADFDGDGKWDVVAVNPRLGEITVATNSGVSSGQVSAALNAASFVTTQGIAAGSLISLFGASMSGSGAAQASAIPLPNSLGGTSVTINGTPAPLTYVSATQINAQVPWTVSTGTASIVVTNNGQALPAFSATVIPSSPGIFSTQSGSGQAIAINPDGSLAGPTGSIPGIAVRPATPGDALIILATGLGSVDSAIPDGAASSDKLRNTVTMPQVLIDGISAAVAFSGLSPQFVGVNQINVTVPAAAKSGVVSLQLRMSGITSTDKVTIAIQ